MRPSQVLPLPHPPTGRPSGVAPAGGHHRRDGGGDHGDAGGGHRWGTGRLVAGGVVAAVLLALLGSAALPDGGGAPPPALTTDVVTEDAVVAVLGLFAAELAIADQLADPAAPIGLPGPSARAAALVEGHAAVTAQLTALRSDVPGPGTPAEAYVGHPDHDALLGVVADLQARTALLAALDALHLTLRTGAATTTAEAADAAVAQAQAGPWPDLATWAAALDALRRGTADPATAAATADAARAATEVAWRDAAAAVAPADLADLAAFLNGIDPGVLAALDGHPVAGPALARLRR